MEFDHTTKLYTHKQESLLENETYKILSNFEVQNRSPNRGQKSIASYNLQKKKRITCRIVNITFLADHKVKNKENVKRFTYLDFARNLKMLCSMRRKVLAIVIVSLAMVNRKLKRDHQHYSINKIGKNIKKSPGELKRLAATQRYVKI